MSKIEGFPIRLADPRIVSDTRDVLRMNWPGITTEQILQIQRQIGLGMVLVKDGVMGLEAAAGFVEGVSEGEVRINFLNVMPAYRGKGIGAEMVRRLVHEARISGGERLVVSENNPGRVKFFAKLGFRSGWGDEGLMSLPLRSQSK